MASPLSQQTRYVKIVHCYILRAIDVLFYYCMLLCLCSIYILLCMIIFACSLNRILVYKCLIKILSNNLFDMLLLRNRLRSSVCRASRSTVSHTMLN